MNQDRNQHRDFEAPTPGGNGPQASGRDSDRLTIVSVPSDADSFDAFASEEELAETPSSVESSPSTTGLPSAPARAAFGDVSAISPHSISPEQEATSLSVADLIESNVRLEWHEAVAIARRLCGVMAREPAASVQPRLVEPWNVEITDLGEVLVLPAGPGGDPLVKQVGRILGALLHEATAPPELRLLASLAAFEVPAYASVEELSRALQQFEQAREPDAIRSAFHRGSVARFLTAEEQSRQPTTTPDLLLSPPDSPPVAVLAGRTARSKGLRLPAKWPIAAALLVTVALVFYLLRTPAPGEPQRTVVVTPSEVVPAGSADRPQGPEKVPDPEVPVVQVKTASVAKTTTSHVPASTAASLPTIAPPTGSIPVPPRGNGASVSPPNATLVDTLETRESRAIRLIGLGRSDEAAIAFDTIVMANPFYRLDPARSTSEAAAALQRSKRALLPSLAQRQYESARAALKAGDFDRAIAETERISALLNDPDMGAAPADLSGAVKKLHGLAISAKTAEDEKVYTTSDVGVSLPQPLGRQLPAALPRGIPPGLVGQLEVLINRAGEVERVRLYTPLNAYHDRMIVSAAKAWHYKPALRNGKPVRFQLVISVNLPER